MSLINLNNNPVNLKLSNYDKNLSYFSTISLLTGIICTFSTQLHQSMCNRYVCPHYQNLCMYVSVQICGSDF